MYDVGRRLTLEPVQGNRASSRVDLGETELFCMPAVTSVSFLTCVSVLGDSLEFHQANHGSLCVLWGTWNSSACSAGESGLISRRGGCLMVFLELLQEPGVHSRVTAGMAIQNSCLFCDVRSPV